MDETCDTCAEEAGAPICDKCIRDAESCAARSAVAADRKRAAAHLQRVLDLYPSRRMSNTLRCDLEVVLSYIEIGEPAP